MIRKILIFIFVAPLLISCSIKNIDDCDKILAKDANVFDVLIDQLVHNIEILWGFNEILIIGPKDYIKYTDAYQTRSYINFDMGSVTVETINNTEPIVHLRQALVETLLTDDYSEMIDTSRTGVDKIINSKDSFLHEQIINQYGQLICWENQEIKFADYLFQNCLKSRSNGLRIIYSLTINLIPNHLDKCAYKYFSMVRKAARKYGIDESLILAIIQTESSFNPYAISRSDALGLMQVMQHSAGKDVFRAQGKSGTPSRGYLFDPANNIDTGTAYLAMLNNIYLSEIENPISRRYAVIAAYNSGVGSVLRIFSNNRVQAANIINSMSPKEVYATLITCHPSMESRRYLYKVNAVHNRYQHR